MTLVITRGIDSSVLRASVKKEEPRGELCVTFAKIVTIGSARSARGKVLFSRAAVGYSEFNLPREIECKHGVICIVEAGTRATVFFPPVLQRDCFQV